MRQYRPTNKILTMCVQTVHGHLMSIAFLISLLSTSHATSQAAPISLMFDAPIYSIVQLNATNLPFQLQVGDHIHGEFTFEPFEAASDVPMITDTTQPFDARFQVGTQHLETTQYVLQSWNNVPSIDAPETSKDELYLACSFGGAASCAPPEISDVSIMQWGFALTLLGDSTILDGADIPADPVTWNRFDSRSISLIFKNEGIDVAIVVADVSLFAVVPEPSTMFLLGACCALGVLHARRRF